MPCSRLKTAARAVEQIHTAINQINEVTQQNAALGEELTASSDSMNNEAEDLADILILKIDTAELNQASGLTPHRSSVIFTLRRLTAKARGSFLQDRGFS